MKIIIPILCSLLLIGCSESAPQQASETNVSQKVPAPALEENSSTAVPTEQTEAVAAPSTAASAPAVTENVSVDASALFAQKCASCHGTKAEKSALNKSQLIATLSEQQIKDALKGYQNGTYGRDMKALMQGQAKPLNDAQIEALAKYISAL